jgi:broad specificity phosphatase PhoE
MNHMLPTVYVGRHGETAWTLSGQHTGLKDIPLTETGQNNARRLGNALRGRRFAKVFTSPLQRALMTCQLAGFGAQAEIDPELVEWNYGEYEGFRTNEIHATKRPDWNLFRDGCPGGESAEDVGLRADRVLHRLRELQQDGLIFSSGHFLRVLASRWLGLRPQSAQFFMLSTGSLSALSYEEDLSHPAIKFWNDQHHLMHH